ncbi:DUF916 and DUF3324 domain-containing protein [Enterococcus faecium]|uniref:DUF916 and DUF3324 domain-containing protein n=1 Tax=Enterococcus faecium TaxID=1352 RepID=UPI000CF2C0B5|nr:DUF916 and DUF3324 domain-containing protein [Enterococcus faecium]EGP4754762.1 DUF916 and DUF3324 domain-containing protein [Enterococcus faecium]EME8077185.1 DUF916 and DUF3324 domain-containing protein [Enterococcus faecium]NTJ88479.1 DUF916 and DUF3324 domain-containing protein [Enterococcus faecium]NTR79451.1 DUF916 and DUF3324 domain-containing protein [Enterococcus faecium]NTT04575.1 DUF916 and DUF3324 domain-containing protein [Enterococcus faecium]
MNKIFKLLCISFLSLSLSSPTAYASEVTGGYTIEGIPNENQLDPNLGYFYLHESANTEDAVQVKLINSSAEDKTLKVKITDANTNINGLVDYTGNIAKHPSLKTPLTSIATATQQEVTVPKNSSVETEIKIKMPKEQFKGVIVGGINISEKQSENQDTKKLALSNTYSYTLGLVVTNENKVDINKNVSVELESVGAELFDGKKVVQADILNRNPYIFSGAKVTGKILEKDSKDLVKKEEKQNVNIAPYSVFPFQIDWQKENLKPGKYIFKGIVETKDNKWEFEKEFEIIAEKAKEINNESVFKVQIPEWLTYTALSASVVTIGGTVWLVIRKRRKEHE